MTEHEDIQAMRISKTSQAIAVARRVFRHENTALIMVLIALIGVLSFVTKGAITNRANVMNILLQTSTRGVAAAGETFVILSGNFDLSVGGLGLMTAVLGARLMTLDPKLSIVSHPFSVLTGIVIMLVVGAAWGALNGSITARLGIPSLVVTLGTWQIATGIAFLICKGLSITNLPLGLAFFGQGSVAGVPVPAIILIVVFAISYVVLHYTTFGRSIYAVGGNVASAWLSGINAKAIQFVVFIISGCLAGLAGVIFTARTMSASFRTLLGLELDSIAAVIIGGVSLTGGKGTVIGALIGAVLVGIVNNGMSILHIGGATAGIVKGAIIITAVSIDFKRRRGG